MKEGTGDDPFESENDDDAHDSINDVEKETESTVHPEDGTGAVTTKSDEIPYVLRRSAVNEGRTQVGFALRDSTMSLEKESQRDIEDLVDADVYQSDLREAAFIIGLQHTDKVADLLLDWGYEYR